MTGYTFISSACDAPQWGELYQKSSERLNLGNSMLQGENGRFVPDR
jgi:hypothetical protein